MFGKMWLWLVCLLLLGLLFARQTVAQQGTPYSVTAAQSVNARQCPRLDCAIVRALEPGTIINVVTTVSGDTVFGSDQWAQVEDDGVEMYVHTALISPVEDAAPPADIKEIDTSEIPALDTARWTEFTLARFNFRVPRGWIDLEELATDAEFLAGVEETYGNTARQWYEDAYAMIEAGIYDLILVELDVAGVLYVSHFDLENTALSPRYLRRVLESQVENAEGSELISSEIIDLPAGTAVRIESRIERVDGRFNQNYMYAVICDNDAFLLSLVVFGAGHAEYYAPVAHAIANSLAYDPSDL